jgi:hypothetical protein
MSVLAARSRTALWAGVPILVATMSCGTAPGTLELETQPPWGAVLGGVGHSTADALIGRSTPPCVVFRDEASLVRESTARAAELARRLGIDLARRMRSAVVQRTLRAKGYDIEVVRLEVFDGIYLPLNVYVPDRRLPATPIVLSPVGCQSSCWSPEPQTLAANLAQMGILVVLSEGFCGNGARASLPDGDLRVGYARALLGLPSDSAIHLQELVTTLSWVIESHAAGRPGPVGVAGYSYGGGMSLLLAQVDPRVDSVSVPATLMRAACAAPAALPSDIHVQEAAPDFMWSVPLEVPVPPSNSLIAALYPRYLHTTAGSNDRGAPATVIESTMAHAGELYALGGKRDRVRFIADDGDHNYGRGRREDTYEWFARTLLHRAQGRREAPASLRTSDELAVDIGGTRTLNDELIRRVRAEREYRFLGGRPTSVARARALRAAADIFGRSVPAMAPELTWNGLLSRRQARAWRYRGDAYDAPVIEVQGDGRPGSGTLLYLPSESVAAGLPAVWDRARRYERVVAVDYLGIGELASDRLLLHTFACALMFADQSLPQANVALLRGVLAKLGPDIEVEGTDWATSLYASVLRALEPGRVRRVHLSGVPSDELEWLQTGKRVPDLLLHPALFARLTVAELS